MPMQQDTSWAGALGQALQPLSNNNYNQLMQAILIRKMLQQRQAQQHPINSGQQTQGAMPQPPSWFQQNSLSSAGGVVRDGYGNPIGPAGPGSGGGGQPGANAPDPGAAFSGGSAPTPYVPQTAAMPQASQPFANGAPPIPYTAQTAAMPMATAPSGSTGDDLMMNALFAGV